MSKATILDRLAGAMETLGKREGKALTPRQRVAAAQRWNSINEIADREDTRLYDNWMNNKSVYNEPDGSIGRDEFEEFHEGIYRLGLPDEGATGANPFLSRIPEKYHEQDNFLYWCTKNGYAPTQENLKRYRWEEYQRLPDNYRQWIANKDAVRNYMRDNYTLYGQQPPELKTLQDVDEYWTKNVYNGVEPKEGYLEYARPKRQPYSSMDEFPDDFDYMWRY